MCSSCSGGMYGSYQGAYYGGMGYGGCNTYNQCGPRYGSYQYGCYNPCQPVCNPCGYNGYYGGGGRYY